jgi:hypothetical protein
LMRAKTWRNVGLATACTRFVQSLEPGFSIDLIPRGMVSM